MNEVPIIEKSTPEPVNYTNPYTQYEKIKYRVEYNQCLLYMWEKCQQEQPLFYAINIC